MGYREARYPIGCLCLGLGVGAAASSTAAWSIRRLVEFPGDRARTANLICPLHRAQGALIESGMQPRVAMLAVRPCPPQLAVDPDELSFDLSYVQIEYGWRVIEVARIHPEPVCLACFMHAYRHAGTMYDTCPAKGRLMFDCWRPDRPPL